MIFAGQVQGVGFRYTTCRIAGQFSIKGYVRNMPDGRVECVAEGTGEDLASFVTTLHQAMRDYISDCQTLKCPSDDKLDGFSVKF